jgi:probable HAF family extracellular repeat protein
MKKKTVFVLTCIFILYAGASNISGSNENIDVQKYKGKSFVDIIGQDIDPFFIGLGDLPGAENFSWSWDVTQNGSAATGYSQSDEVPNNEAFIWTKENGLEGLGVLGKENLESRGYGISNDGTKIAGWSNMEPFWTGGQAFRWTKETGMEGIGFLDNMTQPPSDFGSWAWDISEDGNVIAGYSPNSEWDKAEAFRWTEDEGMIGLGHLIGGESDPYSEAMGTNIDGTVIVGMSWDGESQGDNKAFYWTEDGGMINLGTLGGKHSTAYDVSPDGSVAVGEAATGEGAFNVEAFRWTVETGIEPLGFLPGGSDNNSVAYSASNYGKMIVGFGKGSSGFQAFIWTEDNGMQYLAEVLETDYGLDLTGWDLTIACSVSLGGHYIVGKGIGPNGSEAWMAFLGNSAPYEPSSPDPEDGSTNADVNADINWIGGDPDSFETVYYDIYFGDTSPPPLVASDKLEEFYELELLDYETKYYWQIIAKDGLGNVTESPIWDFTVETNTPPEIPEINGLKKVKPNKLYNYTFVTTDPDNFDVYYYVDWDDGSNTGWVGPYASGKEIYLVHEWLIKDSFTIRAKAKDTLDLESNTGTFDVKVPRNKIATNSLFLLLLEKFPNVYPILKSLFRL